MSKPQHYDHLVGLFPPISSSNPTRSSPSSSPPTQTPLIPLHFPSPTKNYRRTMTRQTKASLQRSNTNSSSFSRSGSYNSYNSNKIIPSGYYPRSTPPIPEQYDGVSSKLLVRRDSNSVSVNKVHLKLSALLRSLFFKVTSFPNLIIPATCKWLSLPAAYGFSSSLTPTLGRKVTGTLFGNRRGHVSFAVQDDPRSDPALVVELAMSTSTLVKEMSSGLVRIALECEKAPPGGAHHHPRRRLFSEPRWTMYCNGKSCGYALSRACTELDLHVLSTVQTVSAGAGVIPMVEDGARKAAPSEGELLYMRARFERVVGSRDSEAFYMMNPDGNGGPELSIFLLRL